MTYGMHITIFILTPIKNKNSLKNITIGQNYQLLFWGYNQMIGKNRTSRVPSFLLQILCDSTKAWEWHWQYNRKNFLPYMWDMDEHSRNKQNQNVQTCVKLVSILTSETESKIKQEFCTDLISITHQKRKVNPFNYIDNITDNN